MASKNVAQRSASPAAGPVVDITRVIRLQALVDLAARIPDVYSMFPGEATDFDDQLRALLHSMRVELSALSKELDIEPS